MVLELYSPWFDSKITSDVFFMENLVLEAGDSRQIAAVFSSAETMCGRHFLRFKPSVSLDKTAIKNSMVNASKMMSGEVDHNL